MVVTLTICLVLFAGLVEAGVPTITGWDTNTSYVYQASLLNNGEINTFAGPRFFSAPYDPSAYADSNTPSLWSAGFTEASSSYSGHTIGAITGNDALNISRLKTNPSVSANQISKISISPVPEPETYAMIFAGLVLIGFSARRRKSDTFD